MHYPIRQGEVGGKISDVTYKKTHLCIADAFSADVIVLQNA